ncbi:hypothetical protein D3C71_1787890 [compost metagenome]
MSDHLAAIEADRAGLAWCCPVENFHQFGSPGAHQPGDAKNFATVQRKADVMHTRTGNLTDLQPFFTARLVEARVLFFQLTADHHFYQRIFL